MTERLLTERKFFLAKSIPGFFPQRDDNRGYPIFWNVTTEKREEGLTISVIEGANTPRQDFTSHVGKGSNRQEALGDSRTILHTSSIDGAEKLSRFSLGVTGRSRDS